MFHALGMNNHALTVVMRQYQLTEHVSYLKDILPCPDRCHETMTTGGACFYLRNTLPFSDRCHETMATYGACFIPEWVTPYCDRCHEMMATDGVCFILARNHHALTIVMGR